MQVNVKYNQLTIDMQMEPSEFLDVVNTLFASIANVAQQAQMGQNNRGQLIQQAIRDQLSKVDGSNPKA